MIFATGMEPEVVHHAGLSTWEQVAVIAASIATVYGMFIRPWLQRLLGELRQLRALATKELTHNGGSSMKDHVRDARDSARAAEVAATFANERAEAIEQVMEAHQVWALRERALLHAALAAAGIAVTDLPPPPREPVP